MSTTNSSPHRFNRFELKYVADLARAAARRDELRDRLDVDTQGAPNGVYPLWSLYFDSPSLIAYREKIDGQRFRRKLRILRTTVISRSQALAINPYIKGK